MARRPPLSRTKLVVFSVLPTAFLLLLGELGARSYYFPYRPRQTYTELDACSGREITFSVNAEGGRGLDWMIAKQQGTLRILAVGGSSTFGVNSPDDATWPAVLEADLRQRHGGRVEILNGGQSGIRLEGIVDLLSEWLIWYQPDLVIYYGAYNNTQRTTFTQIDALIESFHRSREIGRLASLLYYRSMLYTYLVEKIHFHLVTRSAAVVPEIEYFQMQLQRFIQLLRERNVTPLLVLEMTELPPEPSLGDLGLDDRPAVKTLILKAVDASSRTSYERLARIRVYQTQVLWEVIRRTGKAQGVQVIDPRPAFEHEQGARRVFCDEVHLTDFGNQILARIIADSLDLSTIAPRPLRSRPRTLRARRRPALQNEHVSGGTD